MAEPPKRDSGSHQGAVTPDGATVRTIGIVRPDEGRSQFTEFNTSLMRLTEIVARIAERIERQADTVRLPDRPAA